MLVHSAHNLENGNMITCNVFMNLQFHNVYRDPRYFPLCQLLWTLSPSRGADLPISTPDGLGFRGAGGNQRDRAGAAATDSAIRSQRRG